MSNFTQFRSLPKNDIDIVMGDLNIKVGGSDSTLLGLPIRSYDVDNRNKNGQRLADFYTFHCLITSGPLFGNIACHKVSSVSTNRQRTSNQIKHTLIFLMILRSKRSAEFDFHRGHY